MQILKRQALWTLMTVVFLGAAVHFFLNAYQAQNGQQELLAQMEFRQRFVRQQVAEMQHKRKVIEQVNAFVGGAEDLGLAPSNWTRYEVNIEAPLRFHALAEILKQCTSTSFYYFQPDHLKVRLAGQQAMGEAEMDTETIQVQAPDGGVDSGDLFLQLKGTFLARRR